MYFKVAILIYLCLSNFWNTPKINFYWPSYLSSVNSRPILMWSLSKQEQSSLEIEYENKNKELKRREQNITQREKYITQREKRLDILNQKVGEAEILKKLVYILSTFCIILLGIVVLVIIKSFNFLSAPLIKGSSSDARQNSGTAIDLLSWLSEKGSPKLLESLSNKDESKQLPEGDDVKESKEIE